MAKPKRSAAQRDAHLVDVSKWYLSGIPQREIGSRLGLSQQQISYDLKKLRAQWLDSALINFNEAKANELAKIDNLEREYWDAWERSKTQKETKSSKAKPDPTDANVGRVTEQMEKTEDLLGNAAFLRGVQWCINKRCEILGLDSMTKSLNVDFEQLSDQQLERIANGEDVWNVISNPGEG